MKDLRQLCEGYMVALLQQLAFFDKIRFHSIGVNFCSMSIDKLHSHLKETFKEIPAVLFLFLNYRTHTEHILYYGICFSCHKIQTTFNINMQVN